MERTALRPLASGELSTREALTTLAACSVGGALCLIPLNSVAQTICVAAVVPIGLYPSLKRFTYFPQVFLGLTFNLGALVGFAVKHERDGDKVFFSNTFFFSPFRESCLRQLCFCTVDVWLGL